MAFMFEMLDKDVALHLAEVKAYKSGMVELRYEVGRHGGERRNATKQPVAADGPLRGPPLSRSVRRRSGMVDHDRNRAHRRTAAFLTIAGVVLWIPLIARLSGRGGDFVGRLGFVDGPSGTIVAWLLAIAFAVAAVVFTLRRVPGVAAHAFVLSGLKALALFAAVGAAVVEEAFFRRVVMDTLRDVGQGPVVQVTLSAIVFGAAHSLWALFTKASRVGAKAAVATTVLGVGFAVIYLAGDRSLAPVIVAHFLIDALIQPGILVSAFRGQWIRAAA